MHIVGNVLRKHLKYFIGEIDDNVFDTLKKADLKDYSNVDRTNTSRGRNKLELDDVELEEIEIWTDLVRDKINKLTFKTLRELENSYSKEKVGKTTSKPRLHSLQEPKIVENIYEIDDDNTLIVRKDIKDILKILPDFNFKEHELQLTKTKK